MARPYVVTFPRAACSLTPNSSLQYDSLGVVANLQSFEAGTYLNQPLILNQFHPGTIPDVPFLANNPIPAVGLSQPLPLGSGTVIPGGSRSIVIVSPTGSEDLNGLTFTVNGLDQFRNAYTLSAVGPVESAGVEFPVPTGAVLPLPPTNTFVRYFSNLTSITFSGTIATNFTVWVSLGGYGVTPFIGVDTYRIGWKGSVEISGFTAASTTWSYTVYGTNYPIYTAAPGGNWAPLNSTNGSIGKHLISVDSLPAGGTNMTFTELATNKNMSAAVNNAWAEVTSPTSYLWAEVGRIGDPASGALTQPASFILSYVQQGA